MTLEKLTQTLDDKMPCLVKTHWGGGMYHRQYFSSAAAIEPYLLDYEVIDKVYTNLAFNADGTSEYCYEIYVEEA